MITVTCKQCGKQHSRPNSQGGAMIFCDCGNGVRVPFSSSLDPEVPDFPEVLPLRFPASSPPIPPPDQTELAPVPVEEAPPNEPLPSRHPDRRYRKVDPTCCWHHEETASAERCGACQLPFCAHCLVHLNKQVLCGPCKNFRIAQVGQPTRTLPLAITALVASLVVGPAAFVLSQFSVGLQANEGATLASALLAMLAMLLPGMTLAASLVALLRLEAQSLLAGRAMATSGLCVSMAAMVWGGTVLVVIVGRQAGG